MNRYEIRRQFGCKPDLAAVLVFSLQQALRGSRTHPDSKRQRKTRLNDLTKYYVRILKTRSGGA